jgi:hypothetical protein
MNQNSWTPELTRVLVLANENRAEPATPTLFWRSPTLAEAPAVVIVVSTHAELVARGIVERTLRRFGLPVVRVVGGRELVLAA